MNGIFRGLLVGGLTGGLGLVAMSLLAPMPSRDARDRAVTTPVLDQAASVDTVPLNRPDRPDAPSGEGAAVSGTLELPAGSEFNRPPPEGEPRLSDGSDPAIADSAPRLSAGGDAGSLPGGTAPGAAPETETGALAALTPPTESPANIALPGDGGAAPQAAGESGTPTVPAPETLPEKPQTAETPAVVLPDPTAPAPDADPATPGAEQAAPVQPGAPEQSTVTAQPGTTPGADTASAPSPSAPAPTSPATAPGSDAAPATPAPATTPQPAPEVAAVPIPRNDTALPSIPDPATPRQPDPGDVDADTDTQDTATPALGALRVPVPGREIRLPDVRTGRLPTVGGDAAVTVEAVEAPAAEDEIDPATLGALARYAAPFTREGEKPLFSIVLIDEGDGGLDRATLSTFTFPVTFALDPTRPGAADAMRAYRAAGFEVVLLARGLPEGASPSDLEVTLASYLNTLPETVAVMTPAQSALQSSRPLLQQLMAVTSETGHGVLTFDRGLNAAGQLARSFDVPAATAFRELDAEQEPASTIRRYLSRAAFKAGQDGQVVMVGRNYADTVTALFAWALESQGDVTLAPLSAILRGQ